MMNSLRIGLAAIIALGVTSPTPAPAQTRLRETGSFSADGYVMWIRGTSDGIVQLYVARGYRDAFTKPHDLSPERIASWRTAVAAMRTVRRSDGDTTAVVVRQVLGDSTISFERRLGDSGVGLAIDLSPDERVHIAEPIATQLSDALGEAAAASVELSASASAAKPELRSAAHVANPEEASASHIASAAAPNAAPANVAPAGKQIRTPLGPFFVPEPVLRDHDTQVQYCYTQLGLKYDPKLTGQITLRVTLGEAGTVQDVAVIRRSWEGVPAGEVEACIRALMRDWTIPNAGRQLTKEISFSFGVER